MALVAARGRCWSCLCTGLCRVWRSESRTRAHRRVSGRARTFGPTHLVWPSPEGLCTAWAPGGAPRVEIHRHVPASAYLPTLSSSFVPGRAVDAARLLVRRAQRDCPRNLRPRRRPPPGRLGALRGPLFTASGPSSWRAASCKNSHDEFTLALLGVRGCGPRFCLGGGARAQRRPRVVRAVRLLRAFPSTWTSWRRPSRTPCAPPSLRLWPLAGRGGAPTMTCRTVRPAPGTPIASRTPWSTSCPSMACRFLGPPASQRPAQHPHRDRRPNTAQRAVAPRRWARRSPQAVAQRATRARRALSRRSPQHHRWGSRRCPPATPRPPRWARLAP